MLSKAQEIQRKWYLKNREKEIEKSKRWYAEHTDEAKTYRKEYYAKNSDEIRRKTCEYKALNKERIQEKIPCECGDEVVRNNIARHRKSKKHMEWAKTVAVGESH